jgi:tetratricopeptide (TPR) repeat protein
MVALIAIAVGCGGTPETGTDDWQAEFAKVEEAFDATEDPAEKAALAENFLARFPETEETGDVAGVIVYYRGRQLGDWESVWKTLSAASEAVTDPETDLAVALELRDAAQALDRDIDLAPFVSALEAERALTFGEHMKLMAAGGEDEDWAMTEKHARAGLALATPEAFRADYPDREFTDEDAARRAARREGTARAWLGWALANTDRIEEATTEFETADATSSPGYFGVPSGPLYRLWGATETEHGDRDAGMERLARAALWTDDHDAMELLESLYPTDEAATPFEDWLWETRVRTARTVDSVTLEDYQGTEHSLDDLRGEAILLAFWFPT